MLFFLANQTATRSTGSEMLVMLFLFLGMWFLLITPQRKKQKKLEQMIKELKSGDHIMTSAGIYGKIKSVKEKSFIIELDANSTMEIHKSSVQTKITETK